jgi:hypothetical protein
MCGETRKDRRPIAAPVTVPASVTAPATAAATVPVTHTAPRLVARNAACLPAIARKTLSW